MAATAQLQQMLQPMDFTGNSEDNFKFWLQKLNIYIIANSLEETSEARKINILLNFIGEKGLRIYNSFNLTDQDLKFKTVVEKFKNYFAPRKSLTIIRNEFFTAKQNTDEKLEDFFTKIINIGLQCEFGTLREALTTSKIIAALDSKYNNVKTKLISEDDATLTLEYVMKYLKNSEISRQYVMGLNNTQSTNSTNGDFSVNYIRNSKKKTIKPSSGMKMINSCRNCGKTHLINKCPAFGKQCFICKRQNHFSNSCRSKKPTKKVSVNELNITPSTSVESLDEFFIGMVSMDKSEIVQNFEINGKVLKVKFDTGAGCNIISKNELVKLDLSRIVIDPVISMRVVQVDGKVLPISGICNLVLTHPNRKMYNFKFIVTEVPTPTLIGCKTCLDHNFVSANKKLVDVHLVNVDSDISQLIIKLKNDYNTLFDGKLGCLPRTVSLVLKDNAEPVVQAARRVPFALRSQLQQELATLEEMCVIEKVSKPTQWVHNLVLVKKPNSIKIRICIDPRELNKNLVLPKFQILTFEEIKSRIQNAKYFALLDASNGFWQLKLDESSADLCTFITPYGRYRFKRVPFGVASAPEEFHRIISQMFENIEGVVTYLDDICVWGDSIEQLHKRLITVLNTARNNGMKLNETKCKFFCDEILFVGHKFSADGVTPDPSKVQAIKAMERPKCVKDLQRLLGMCNYLSKFIINYSKITAPLRILLKKDTVFTWDSIQETAFSELKSSMSTSPCLAYFDTNNDVVLSVDSSSVAIGVVLIQDGKPIAFGSRALTSCEQNYCQLEKEMLAIVYGCYKMHQYTYGRQVYVESDHKPLETLFNKPLYKVPARLQRMMLAVQGYNLDVHYKPGRELVIADTLSRNCPNNQIDKKLEQLNENVVCHVKMIRDNLPISQQQFQKFKNAIANDITLNTVIKYIESGWPKNRNDVNSIAKCYWDFREELSVLDGIILKNSLIVVPKVLRSEMLKKLHGGHVALTTCKIRARSSVFWPGLNKDLSNYINKCESCIKYQPSNRKEPLLSHEIEKIPWYKIGMDICMYDDKYYLVLIDYYSKFLEVAMLQDLTTNCVVLHCKSIFARHGIPAYVVSDSGSQFTADNFKKFAFEYEFTHIITSPKHSQSNGMAESGVKILKNILKKCKEDGTDPYLGLLNYRNTEKPYMPSPAQLLMSRNLNSVLPTSKNKLKPKVVKCDKRYDNCLKSVSKYYNKSAKPLCDLPAEQKVVFKKSLTSDWSPGKITSKSDNPRSYNILSENGNTIVRNRKFVSPVSGESIKNVADDNNVQVQNRENNRPYVTRSGRQVIRPDRLNL